MEQSKKCQIRNMEFAAWQVCAVLDGDNQSKPLASTPLHPMPAGVVAHFNEKSNFYTI